MLELISSYRKDLVGERSDETILSTYTGLIIVFNFLGKTPILSKKRGSPIHFLRLPLHLKQSSAFQPPNLQIPAAETRTHFKTLTLEVPPTSERQEKTR